MIDLDFVKDFSSYILHMSPNITLLYFQYSTIFDRKIKILFPHSHFLPTEASLGGDNFNDVAVSAVEVSGVKIIDDNNSTLFDFEGGLGGV